MVWTARADGVWTHVNSRWETYTGHHGDPPLAILGLRALFIQMTSSQLSSAGKKRWPLEASTEPDTASGAPTACTADISRKASKLASGYGCRLDWDLHRYLRLEVG